MYYKRKIFAIHSWLGLIAGIFILAISLSGSFVALMHQYEETFDHEKLFVKPAGKYLPYDTLFSIAKKKISNFGLYDFAFFPKNPNETLEILYFPDGTYHSVFMNPYTGEITGKMDNNLSKNLLKFHWSLFLGPQGYIGSIVVFALSICLLLNIVTGFIIYRKHIIDALLFKAKINWKSIRLASSGLHRIIGVWSMVFMFIIFASGAYINYHIINGDFAYPGGEKLKHRPKEPLQVSVDQCIRLAKEKIPGFEPSSFSFPQLEGGELYVSGYIKGQNRFYLGNSWVTFNSKTGKVLEVKTGIHNTLSSKLDIIISHLHFGNYGGVWLKIFYSFFSVLSGLMPITGFILWFRKRKPLF